MRPAGPSDGAFTVDVRAGTLTPGGGAPMDLYSLEAFRLLAEVWTKAAWQRRLSYEPRWMGVSVIQMPEDIVMMAELIFHVRPDVIVEIGVAHGGSSLFYASLMELAGRGRVVGVDVDIRTHNRSVLEANPLSRRISLIEGSSVAPATAARVRNELRPDDAVLVILDSNHTRAHVAAELEAYAPMVTVGSFLVVFDGVMKILHDVPNGAPDWTDDNPDAAVRDFLARHPEFRVEPYYNRLMITHAPGGFLRRIR